MRDFPLRIWFKGNPGNISMMYMTALKLNRMLGFGDIINTSIPIFDIELEDRNLGGKIGLHDSMAANLASRGLFPFEGYRCAVLNSFAAFLSMEGFYQHVDNFMKPSEFDYDGILKLDPASDHGHADELVISIRGGDILQAIHKDDTMIPIEFYEYLVERTRLKPVFFGQLGDNPYCDALRHRFPTATFREGTNPRSDFNFLRRSINIVPSVSTFSCLAAWLSHAEKIYLPLTGLLNPNSIRVRFLFLWTTPDTSSSCFRPTMPCRSTGSSSTWIGSPASGSRLMASGCATHARWFQRWAGNSTTTCGSSIGQITSICIRKSVISITSSAWSA